MVNEWIFLTGATGFLGQQILRDLLAACKPVAVLMRSVGFDIHVNRYKQLLATIPSDLHYLLRPIYGDLSADGLRIDTEDRAFLLDHSRATIHSAADTSFSGDPDPFLTNVNGTRNLMRFLKPGNALHYVSTAFVCGKQEPGTTIYEAEPMVVGANYNNPYEESKYVAERIVRDTWRGPATIYRPTIIVGHSKTGAAPSFKNFYLIPRFAAVLGKIAQTPAWTGLQLNMRGDEPLNIVPVDFVSACILKALDNPTAQGVTYQINSDPPPLTKDLKMMVCELFKLVNVVFAGDRAQQGEQEQQLHGYLGHYAAYWGTDTRFDTKNTRNLMLGQAVTVGQPLMRKLIEYAVDQNFGKREMAPPIEQPAAMALDPLATI